jgi:hypothetical protein
MKLPSLRTLLLLGSFAAVALVARAADSGFKNIFNGKDLTGWDGMKEFWTVRDGAITGQTTADRVLKANTFLVWKGGDVKNFELRAQFRLVGEKPNSGIQYRSKVLDAATYVVGGYQADIDTGRYIGMLYEEKGRGILMQPGQKVRIGPASEEQPKKGKAKAKVETLATVTPQEQLAAAFKPDGWNEIIIIAKGNHLQHFINGKLAADVTDTDDAKGSRAGVLALQLHQGPPMTVQFRNVQLKTLP